MKNIFKYIVTLSVTALFLISCDKGFDDLNINKTSPTSLDPAFLLNQAIVRSSFPGSILTFEEAIVQQIVTPNPGVFSGGNFNVQNRDAADEIWQKYYRDVMRYTVEVKNMTKNNPETANLYNMARIWHSYAAMVLTDTYGDVPYTSAALGYIEKNLNLVYDSQESIYKDLLKELDEASAAIDISKPKESKEVLYSGDFSKWKRFGYSLLLRAAMRLSKVDQTRAQEYVAKAVAGGLMTSNADNTVVRHTSLYINDIGNLLNGSESSNFYLTSTFVNYLKSNNDPRLSSIAVRYVGASSGAEQIASKISKDTAQQIGMPMGYDNNSLKPVFQAKGLKSFYEYSQLDRTRMGKKDAPSYLVTYAQTQLLLAEAIVRGWATGDASSAYKNGVKAHLKQMGEYDANSKIDSLEIENFVSAQTLEAGKELEQINTQYWVASFLNGPEAFANFRRSGFPKLTPNNYPGRSTAGEFIRRITYPDSEFAVNFGNIQEALNRQGADNLDTRVWWDKE